ncbi:agamous-like MADS-box protein MADS9 isoform X2 [Macadamia integrifolia]|uniref:agamous-like MADS-box protein MADS9 isoform X2 n=1 Tax=Macadamia integrifolia TaxID=60698 RepID=UPI001C500E68|nr:agamous-like MADS-box protein MADS9 isoform X2 [Macadamia integrifolia]
MGRGKIEIKRIENSTNRQVTYSKRKNGIMKKAKELTVLCDAKVSLILFSSSGKMSEYRSPSVPMSEILDKYHKYSGKKLWDAKHEFLSNELDRIKKENDNMQIELRHLKGEDVNSLHHKELATIEEALENGLTNVRAKEMEYFKMLKKNVYKDQHKPVERILEEENKRLTYILHQQQMAMDGGCVREMENDYHHRGRDYHHSQMPFAFRVQPNQPNLQEAK